MESDTRPSSLRQLVPYLERHPRVRRWIPRLLPTDLEFAAYVPGMIFWLGGPTLRLWSVTDGARGLELGLQFDAAGFTTACAGLAVRYDYLP